MIEYGLSVSVSLDGTPRTPHCCDYGPSPVNNAPRKYMSFGDFVGGVGGDSVSPRVLFSDVAVVAAARRLDFSSLPLNTSDLSPVSFASASVASASVAAASVGDCSVCYNVLPARSNHVFTLCGHLFCVRCVLKWWDTNSTCPICRAELFESVDVDDDVSVGTAAGGGADRDFSNPARPRECSTMTSRSSTTFDTSILTRRSFLQMSYPEWNWVLSILMKLRESNKFKHEISNFLKK